MPESLLPPAPEKPPGNPWRSWPVLVLALLLGGYLFAWKHMASQSSNLHYIYHQTAAGWERVRPPAGFPDKLRVTTGGTVWVRTFGRAALARWDGKTWHTSTTQISVW
jgi:hypothetical protein